MNDFTGRIKRDEWRPPAGFRRTLTCALDTAQYQLDMDALAARRATEDVYASFNLLMRRKPKVRGVLPHLRGLLVCAWMCTKLSMNPWSRGPGTTSSM